MLMSKESLGLTRRVALKMMVDQGLTAKADLRMRVG